MLGLAIAFGGVVIAFADGLAGGGGSVPGDLMCAGAGLLWGVNTVLVKANPTLRRLSFANVLLFQIGGSVPLMLLAAWLVGDLSQPLTPSGVAWLSLAYQTVIVTFASYLVWFWLVMRYQAAAVSGFTFLAPLFGIAAGAAFLGETATPALLLGLAAVVVGMRLLR
jgi:drug/metabolite transporter (DMT)-like permease